MRRGVDCAPHERASAHRRPEGRSGPHRHQGGRRHVAEEEPIAGRRVDPCDRGAGSPGTFWRDSVSMPRSKVMGLLAGAVLVAAACGGGSSNSAAKTATNAAAHGRHGRARRGRQGRRRAQRHRPAAGLGELQGRPRRVQGEVPQDQGRRAAARRQQPAGDRRGQEPTPAPTRRPTCSTSRPPSPRRTLPMFAPYQVAAWADIPANLKEPTGLCFSDYAGFMSVGCDAKKVAAAGDRRGHAQARVQGHDRAQRQPEDGGGRPQRRRDGGARERRLGRRHLQGRRLLQRSSTRRATCCRSTRRPRRSPRARRRASSTGSTTTRA